MGQPPTAQAADLIRGAGVRRWVCPTHVVVNGEKIITAVGLTEATRIVVTFAINGKGKSRVHKVRYLRPSDFETSRN